MRSSSALLAVLLALPTTAWAGACCVGSTSTVPTRVGECERWTAGVSVAAELASGRWDNRGKAVGSSLHEQSIVATVGVGHRLNRQWQLGLQAPARLTHKAAADLSLWGGGQGDLTVSAMWDPAEERPRIDGVDWKARPVPIVTFGARLPTGRAWDKADGALMEDVTGRGEVALSVGLRVERTLDKTPWSLGITGELGQGRGATLGRVDALATVGQYFGTRWSVLGTLRHQSTWMSGHSARTAFGGRVVYGVPRAWRAYAGVEADVPVAGLGRSMMRVVTPGVGVVGVR